MKTSSLRKAIERGCLDAVISALEGGADIEETDLHGHSGLPLRLACFYGHVEIVAELIDRGADVFAPNAEGPEAPLRIATRARHHDVVNLLLKHVSHVSLNLLESDDPTDRRKNEDRRKINLGPPTGMKDRRAMEDRRTTLVREVRLSDTEWEAYFTSRKTTNNAREQELAEHVFEKVRD